MSSSLILYTIRSLSVLRLGLYAVDMYNLHKELHSGGIGRRYQGHEKNSDTVQFREAIGSLGICGVRIPTCAIGNQHCSHLC